jgi:hypothetical protein
LSWLKFKEKNGVLRISGISRVLKKYQEIEEFSEN